MLSLVKNKLIHAELNSQVQLDNQPSPSGSVDFAVFTSGFSTATSTSMKNWEPLDKVCIFTTHELQFKFSCGFVPGGKSPFGELVLSRGSGTVAEGSRCLFFRLFPLAFPCKHHWAQEGLQLQVVKFQKLQLSTGHEAASEEGNQHPFRL